jgi:hypothetical protein
MSILAALLLIPCLLVEPLGAAGASWALAPQRSASSAIHGRFQQEALTAAVLEVRLSLQERIAARIWSLAASIFPRTAQAEGQSLARVEDAVVDAALAEVIANGEAVAFDLNQPTNHYLGVGAGRRLQSTIVWLAELTRDLQPPAAAKVQQWIEREENAKALARGIDLLRETVNRSDQSTELLRHRYMIVLGDHPMFAGGRILAHQGPGHEDNPRSTIYISLDALEFAAQPDAPQDGLRYVLEHENHHRRANPGGYVDENGHSYKDLVERQCTSKFYEQFEEYLRRRYRQEAANLTWDQMVRRSKTLMYLQVASHLLCVSDAFPEGYGLVPFLENSMELYFQALRAFFLSSFGQEQFDGARFTLRIGNGLNLESSLRPRLRQWGLESHTSLPQTSAAAHLTVELPPEAPLQPLFAGDRQFSNTVRTAVIRHDNNSPVLVARSVTDDVTDGLLLLRGHCPAESPEGRALAEIQQQLGGFVRKADRGFVTQGDLVPLTSALEDAAALLARQALDQVLEWVSQDLRGLGVRVESGREGDREVLFLWDVQESAATAETGKERLNLLKSVIPALLHLAEEHRSDGEAYGGPLREARDRGQAALQLAYLYDRLAQKRAVQQRAEVVSSDGTQYEIFAIREASGRVLAATTQPYVFEVLTGGPPATIDLMKVPSGFHSGLRLLVAEGNRFARTPDDLHEVSDPQVISKSLPPPVAERGRHQGDLTKDFEGEREEMLSRLYGDPEAGIRVFEALGAKAQGRAIIYGDTPLANVLALAGMKTLFITPSARTIIQVYRDYMNDMFGIFYLGGLLVGFEADLGDPRAAHFLAQHPAHLVVAIQAPLAPESLAAIRPASDVLMLYVGPQPAGWQAYEEALRTRGGWIIERTEIAALPQARNPGIPAPGRIYRLRRDTAAARRPPPVPPAAHQKTETRSRFPPDWADRMKGGPIMRERLGERVAGWFSGIHLHGLPFRWATRLSLLLAEFAAHLADSVDERAFGLYRFA